MKTGFCIGKFAPLHSGHIDFFKECLKHVDDLFIVMVYDERFVQKQPEDIRPILKSAKRQDDLISMTKGMRCHVLVVEETDIPEYPNGWQEFADLVRTRLSRVSKKYTPEYIFTSDPDYLPEYQKYFPEYTPMIFHREEGLSATRVRKDLLDAYKAFRYFQKKGSVGVKDVLYSSEFEKFEKIFSDPDVFRHLCRLVFLSGFKQKGV